MLNIYSLPAMCFFSSDGVRGRGGARRWRQQQHCAAAAAAAASSSVQRHATAHAAAPAAASSNKQQPAARGSFLSFFTVLFCNAPLDIFYLFVCNVKLFVHFYRLNFSVMLIHLFAVFIYYYLSHTSKSL